ncbi:MAG TPA: SpoIID/LytB domain-containing protein [Firmicutes bacterium]|nr:SpoIID/LytB domain-containing protein [Bacillota bacterium]
MRIRFQEIAVTVLSLMLLAAGGCQWFRPSPKIPEEIRGAEGAEPVLKLYLHQTGETTELPIERYIAGVVAAEMDPDWPLEALAAQAMLARSFTLQKIEEKGGVPERNAHASSDIKEFQAYDSSRINQKVLQAVEKTRGEVYVYRGEFIRGWFHAYAGPKTALADEGLEFEGKNPPYIQIVSSPGGKIIPENEGSWTASFPLVTVQEVVGELAGEDPGPITEVKISATGPSGRATRMAFNGLEVPAASLRLALGNTEMRSTLIDSVQVSGENLVVSGVGYGHGVGMCQWGARALAGEGWNGDKIIDYFFRDVEKVKLWD